MILRDQNFVNYRVEMDYTHGTANWWYTYLLTSVQDPTAFMSTMEIVSRAFEGQPTETALNYKLKGGVYVHLEQEGYLNVQGATSTVKRHQITGWLNQAGGYFKDMYDRTATHHISITVTDGNMLIQVDDSELRAVSLNAMAYGGLVGFGAYGNGSTVSNFTLTALDEERNAVPLDTAQRGYANAYEDTYTGWKPDGWIYEWDDRYVQTF